MSNQATTADYGIMFKVPNSGCSTPDVNLEMLQKEQQAIKKAMDMTKAVKNAMKEKDDEFVSTATKQKKTNYAKTGALIGASAYILKNDVIKNSAAGLSRLIFGLKHAGNINLKSILVGAPILAIPTVIGIAITAGLGAGLGKIVEKSKNKEN